MKKIVIIGIALLSMAFCVNVYAEDVVASWDHDGLNVDWFTIKYKKSSDAVWTNWKTVVDSAARQMVIQPEEYFEPDTEYSFVGVAGSYTLGLSADSNIATWTRPAGTFSPPADNLLTFEFVTPNATTSPTVTP